MSTRIATFLNCLVICSASLAAEIKGTVQQVNSGTATVSLEGDLAPKAGDRAEIFFQLAGTDDNISVASARVQQVDGRTVQLKIGDASGSVEKGQLVRISSSGATAISSPAVVKPSPPNKSSASTKHSLVGEWHKVYEPQPLTFRADGSMQAKEGSEDVTASYRLDTTQTPWQLDLFGFSPAPADAKDVVLPGIVRLENDRLFLRLGEPGKERPTDFGEGTETAVRDSQAPPATKENPIVGSWNVEPSKETYTFSADGKLHTVWEGHGGVGTNISDYSYELIESATPMRLNFYFKEINGNPSWRGIVEFESDSRIRLDGEWTSKEEERPKSFREKAEIFTRGSDSARNE